MKVFLLHRDRDFAADAELHDEVYDAMASGNPFAVTSARRNRERQGGGAVPPSARFGDLAKDLELDTLWRTMAAGDEFLYETAKRVLLTSLSDSGEIRYRQEVLADCLVQRDVVRQLYDLALEALESERRIGGFWFGAAPRRILNNSVQVLKLQFDVLRQMRQLADEAAGFSSEGFVRFFAMLEDELSDEYLDTVGQHLHDLRFARGVVESAEFSTGLKGRDYVVRRQAELGWRERLPFGGGADSYSFTIPPRDENGFKALEEIVGRGINGVANATAQSVAHVKSFFATLRLELAFYLACLNLYDLLLEKDEPTCFPEPIASDELALEARGLYDVCLVFHVDDRVVGNDVDAGGKALVVVTGANQGGKSTFLRSIGLAQLMMQSGMFVGAESLRANVCSGVFTHYKREEDETMEGGKLDEELARMSGIADRIERRSLLLCNESFASTNEREGSELARQIVRAMLVREIKVVFVTHMYDLAHRLHEEGRDDVLFLRAERRPDGTRTFRLGEGEPFPTSYGEDSFRRIFERVG